MSKSEKGFRSRVFCMVFYDEQLKAVTDYFNHYTNCGVIQYFNFIRHNPDTDEESTNTKVHYHACWKCYNAHTTSAIRKQINRLADSENLIQEGKVQVCSDFRIYCRYLLHMDDIEKERYYLKSVITNDKEYYAMMINAENDNQASNDKLFLEKAYKLIKERTDLCFMEIMEELVFDKNINASTVKRYTSHLKACFDSWRFYQHYERGIGEKNNNINVLEKTNAELKRAIDGKADIDINKIK